MQARQQLITQPQDVPQPGQQTSLGPQSSQQTVLQAQLTTAPQQAVLQCHQVTASSVVQDVNSPMLVIPQSVVTNGVIGESNVVPVSIPQQQSSSNPPFNTASLCFLGQETVHEIVGKVQEIFTILKVLNPPFGTVTSSNHANEKRMKLLDALIFVKSLFQKLRFVSNKCNENSQFQGMEYMHIESLIPVKDEWDMKTSEERKTSEAYRLASDECKQLIDLVITRNDQLKEVIDHLRRIIWEINTMLTMRKS